MRNIAFAALLVIAFAVLFSSNAHAQYDWHPGYPDSGGGCKVIDSYGDTGCSSAAASCTSYGNQGFPAAPLYYLVPTFAFVNEPYRCYARCNIGLCFANVSIDCPAGQVIDATSSSGCSPAPVVQPGKLLGGDTLPPPPPCFCVKEFPPPSSPESGTDAGSITFAGEPINIASGNVFYAVTDYQTAGQNPLRFTRYYNSRGTAYATLGSNWHSNFDGSLFANGATQVRLARSDGQLLTVNSSDGVWKSDPDVDLTIVQTSSGWTVTDKDDTVETYVGLSAVLTSIKYRNGYTQNLTRNSDGQLAAVTDSYGRKLTFTYNGGGLLQSILTPDGTLIQYGFTASSGGANLTSITFPTAPATSISYIYDDPALDNALTGVVDENGNRVLSWSYDAYGRGLTSQDGMGATAATTSVSYDDTTGNRNVTGPLGVTETYSFTTLQGVPKVVGISRAATLTTVAAARSFAYDSNGYIDSMTDWNGNRTALVNTSQGLPTTVNEAVGTSVARTTTLLYDSVWTHLPATITTSGLTATFTYDGSGEELTKTLTDTTTSTSPYATEGDARTFTNGWANFLLSSIKTPSGSTTNFAYDATGALVSVTDSLHHATTITSHTGGGLPQTVVDPNGVTTTLTYSPRQVLTGSTVSGTGGTFATSLSYDASVNIIQTTLPDKSYLAYTYDDQHRLIQVKDALGDYASLTLNALGGALETDIHAPGGAVTRKHSGKFDSLGRLLVDTGGAGQATTFTFDSNGNALSFADGLGHKTTKTYDALNRLSSVTDAHAGVTAITYDAHDRIVNVKDANGNTTSYARDGFGDVIQQTSPDSGKTIYHYDSDRNLTQKLDAANVTTNYTYDALDRIFTTAYPADTTENVTFSYDQTGSGFSFGIGRLTSVSDAVGTLVRAYNERGFVLSEKRKHGTVTLTTAYTHDAASRIATITYPSGNTVTYSRDAAGQVTKIATPTATVASGITHLPFGPVNAFTFGNGITDQRSFDFDYRITSLKEAATSTLAVQGLVYSYDAANNLRLITDSVRTGNRQTIGYDALNRLSSATAVDYQTFTYTYDKVGNRLTEGRAGATPTNNYSYVAGTNRLSSLDADGTTTESFTYTPTGNIMSFIGVNGPTVSRLSNKANRVGTITENGTQIAGYTYDGFGQRLVKSLAGTPATGTLFAYAQDGNLLEETNISGAAQADYIYLDSTPIGDLSPASKALYYLHTDHLGTPQLATNGAKATVWAATYEPFGWGNSVTGTIFQNLRLPGQYFDSETGSYHNGFRDYVAILGRYGQADPIGLGGGYNTFAYVSSNPNSYIDPSGEDFLGAGVGTVFGALSGAFGAAAIPGSTPYDVFWGGAFGGVTGFGIGFLDPIPPLTPASIAAIAGITSAVGDCAGQMIGGANTINWAEVIGAGLGGFAGVGLSNGLTSAIIENENGRLLATILGNFFALPLTTFGGAAGNTWTAPQIAPPPDNSCAQYSGRGLCLTIHPFNK